MIEKGCDAVSHSQQLPQRVAANHSSPLRKVMFGELQTSLLITLSLWAVPSYPVSGEENCMLKEGVITPKSELSHRRVGVMLLVRDCGRMLYKDVIHASK
eukprot:scaffold1453_cov204-Ochromonas_danica.AAC.4